MKLSNAVYSHIWMEEKSTEVWLEYILPLAKTRFLPDWINYFCIISGMQKEVAFKNKREKAYVGHPAEQWSEAKKHVQEFVFAVLKACFENNFKLFHLIIWGM